MGLYPKDLTSQVGFWYVTPSAASGTTNIGSLGGPAERPDGRLQEGEEQNKSNKKPNTSFPCEFPVSVGSRSVPAVISK